MVVLRRGQRRRCLSLFIGSSSVGSWHLIWYGARDTLPERGFHRRKILSSGRLHISSTKMIDDRWAACILHHLPSSSWLRSSWEALLLFVVIYFSVKNYEKSNCRLHTVKHSAAAYATTPTTVCSSWWLWNRESSVPSNAIKSTSFGKASAGKFVAPFFYPTLLL